MSLRDTATDASHSQRRGSVEVSVPGATPASASRAVSEKSRALLPRRPRHRSVRAIQRRGARRHSHRRGLWSEEGRLRGLAASLGGDAIRFAGKIDPAAVPQLYAQHDIFVSAAVLDNQPVSILEAFSAGLPVVSTSTGDIPLMVGHGEIGLLVAPGDPVALAEAMAAVWRAPEEARQRAARARREVVKYTWPAVRDQWAAVYAERAPLDGVSVAPDAR
jgi:glycosyltransferase involved in cell wall biosynthesis